MKYAFLDGAMDYMEVVRKHEELRLSVNTIAITNDGHAILMMRSDAVPDNGFFLKVPIIMDGKRLLSGIGFAFKRDKFSPDFVGIGAAFEEWYSAEDSALIFKTMALTTKPEEAFDMYKAYANENEPPEAAKLGFMTVVSATKKVAAKLGVENFTPLPKLLNSEMKFDRDISSEDVRPKLSKLSKSILDIIMAQATTEVFTYNVEVPFNFFLVYIDMVLGKPYTPKAEGTRGVSENRAIEMCLSLMNSYGVETSFADHNLLIGIDVAISKIIGYVDHMNGEQVFMLCDGLHKLIERAKKGVELSIAEATQQGGVEKFSGFSLN